MFVGVIIATTIAASVVYAVHSNVGNQDRTQAFIGIWQSASGWNLPDETHTLVETYEDGWAWSVPLSATLRQVGVAVDGGTTRIRRGPTLHGTYRAEIGKTRELATLISDTDLTEIEVALSRVTVHGGRMNKEQMEVVDGTR